MSGNIVIAGDVVIAGIDIDDRSECKNAVVIEFETIEDLRTAIRTGKADFTVFEAK